MLGLERDNTERSRFKQRLTLTKTGSLAPCYNIYYIRGSDFECVHIMYNVYTFVFCSLLFDIRVWMDKLKLKLASISIRKHLVETALSSRDEPKISNLDQMSL